MKRLLPLILGLCLSTLSHGSEPKAYEARYQARALGMTASASRRQTLTNEGNYLLENRLSLNILGANVGTVIEASEFAWRDGELQPLHYRYDQTGISSSRETIDYDWDQDTAHSSSDDGSWDFEIQPGLLDKLSYSVQLAIDLERSDETEFRYEVLDEDEIKEHVYRISAEEELSTPLGRLNTVKIERVREDDSPRSTTIWLAKDWDYLLVRLEQVSRSGTATELSLESATLSGATVKGL